MTSPRTLSALLLCGISSWILTGYSDSELPVRTVDYGLEFSLGALPEQAFEVHTSVELTGKQPAISGFRSSLTSKRAAWTSVPRVGLPASDRVGSTLPVEGGSSVVLVLFWLGDGVIERVSIGAQSVEADDVMLLAPDGGPPPDLKTTAVAMVVRQTATRQARVHFEDRRSMAIPIPDDSRVESK